MWAAVVMALMVGWPAAMEAEEGEQEVWTVAVMADLNGAYGSTDYNEHVHGAVQWVIEEGEVDGVVIAGDLVAGQMEGLGYEAMWEAFHEVVTRPLMEADIPVAVTPGNHDGSERPRFWRERAEFVRQWERYRPKVSMIDDRHYPFYYAFELGPAVFLSLDGTGVGKLDEAHIHWLMSNPGSDHEGPVFVMSHLPQYPVAQGREREVFDDPRLEEALDGVEVVISGHHHAFYPAKVGESLYLNAGALGSGVRPLLGESEVGERVMTVLRFDAQGLVAMEGRVGPDFGEVLDLESLPERLELPSQRRLDREVLERAPALEVAPE